jgi:hypothetical protein
MVLSSLIERTVENIGHSFYGEHWALILWRILGIDFMENIGH